MLNDKLLNSALKVYAKGLYSSFFLDYKLSQSGQVVRMPLFLQLDTEYPACHKHKIIKTVPSPGGVSKTKNTTIVGRNQVLTSSSITSTKNTSSSKERKT